VSTTIAPDQEEKVLGALKRSLDTTLSCPVKEVTTDQLPILLGVYHQAASRQTRL